MGKKVREYKSGDFIFAKVKGYPAWPARVQKPNGKKYLVYFYGTGEIANLPPNMIFDYSENKDKFLTKTVKRRDFNEGVKQIEYDFANNVPLEEVIGVPIEVRDANNTANDSAIDTTLDDTTADTTANDTAADDTNVTQADAAVEDSDETGALVIDEGKTPSKGRKPKEAKSKETPKAVKTPRGKKREEPGREEEKTDEELVSRSGRKIRPKRYMDEQTEDNATLPSPAPKRRRAASPEKPKESEKEKEKEKDNKTEKSFTQYNVVKQSELEGMKKPFEPSEEDKDKENILLAYLGNGQYAGIRVFDSRPAQFKDDAASLAWHKRAARNALHTKMQLERQHIPASSVSAQLVMELNLTDEEKAALDKERETEEKKSRVNFLKTEMKLIELDAKIKTCLCLEKADTELCLKLLDELLSLEVKPLMLLKHPTCLETVKRLRAYVGNTPSWDLSEQDAFTFSKRAHAIRRQADNLYNSMKEHFQPPEGLSFWEYFSSRVLGFKKATASLNASELLELVHEPKELSEPQAHTMRAAIDEANSVVPPLPDTPELEDDQHKSGKKTPVKAKKPASSPAKARRGRNKKEEAQEEENKPQEKEHQKEAEADGEKKPAEDPSEPSKEPENAAAEQTEDVEMAEPEQTENANTNEQTNDKDATPAEDDKQKPEKSAKESEKNAKDTEKSTKDTEKSPKDSEKTDKKKKSNDDNEPEKKDDKKDKKNSKSDRNGKESEKSEKESEKSGKESDKSVKENDKSAKESDKSGKESDKSGKDREERVGEKSDDKEEKEKMEEPRAKRSRESKKTDPPPRSPAKRKSKV